MTKTMLIDAGHPEETRVVVVNKSRVDEFDFESRSRKQLRANIYLARVTRVEPALQAAFVEYGGNRHGFLAFNEIHPDYYQIPFEDRQKLLEEAKAAAQDLDPDDDDGDDEARPVHATQAFMRKYKIQEVIKRRQILLVQVVKEERGNKGAALTTYLSLAGRYCVLMPNTARGGGISRKITSAADRKRLRAIADELEVPEGMGLIVRTAGAKRTKTELKRDYSYLIKLWETIRERTLTSVAPCIIHEESSLVKRAVRDMYDKDIESILVDGDEAYREAKDFIKMLMPSHAKKVQPYKEETPLFLTHGVEAQLEGMYHPQVTLPSGGYLVINQTEALVAIDVNSGKSTRERNVEATALRTNLEAAEEACRQFRLRDLAGLLVIDFIDMDEAKNNRAVEKKMRDCLKHDRARIQCGKISGFGLMELSRQRRRASIIEGSHKTCPTCGGLGTIRTAPSSALHVLRRIEELGQKTNAPQVEVRLHPETILYVLNEKRDALASVETRCDVRVSFLADETMVPPALELKTVAADGAMQTVAAPVAAPPPPAEPRRETAGSSGDDDEGEGRGRRRRRRGGRGRSSETVETTAETAETTAEAQTGPADAAPEDGEDDKPKRRRRRGRRGGRGRRGTEAAPPGMEIVTPGEDDPNDAEATPTDMDAAADPAPADTAPADDAAPNAMPQPKPEPEPIVAEPDAPEPAVTTNGVAAPAQANAFASEQQPEPSDQDDEAAKALDPAQTAPAPPDPEAENRRKRWQDRMRSWINS